MIKLLEYVDSDIVYVMINTKTDSVSVGPKNYFPPNNPFAIKVPWSLAKFIYSKYHEVSIAKVNPKDENLVFENKLARLNVIKSSLTHIINRGYSTDPEVIRYHDGIDARIKKLIDEYEYNEDDDDYDEDDDN